MATRTITGNVKDLTDSAVASGTVTFEKLVTSTTGNTIHQSGVTTATTDASGDFSIALAVPASGSYRYRMIPPNGTSFYFSIASGASVNVATLIEAETITDQDAVVEALASYLALAGGTMTGNLAFSGAQTVDGVDVSALNTSVSSHTSNTSNPHSVTAAQVGAASSSDLTTHTGLSTTAHGGILPEDAAIVAVSSGRDLASTDAGKILECTGTFTLTCPNGLDTGFQCAVVNVSTGVITLAATTTLTSKDAAVTIASQYGGATVYHAGSNVWRAIGDLS